MATKARHDVAGMHGNVVGASGGTLALTPAELAEFIDPPELIEANLGLDEFDEEPVPRRMMEGSSPPLNAP
jgi:hypothetical protein